MISREVIVKRDCVAPEGMILSGAPDKSFLKQGLQQQEDLYATEMSSFAPDIQAE